MAGEPSTVLIDGGIVMPMDGTKTVHDPGSVLVVDGVIAATGYRPLRLNSSRCESNQAMTSLRFQRLCLPIL